MDLAAEMSRLITSMVLFFFRPMLRFLKFTGTWLIIPVAYFLDKTGLTYTFIGKLATIFTMIFIFYCTIQNLLRVLLKSPDFSIIKMFYGIITEKASSNDYEKSLKEMKSKNPQGFIFGSEGRKFVFKQEDTDGHILVLGGAGSGKSSCLAIPTLYSWRKRIFAIDIKGELSEKTANYRGSSKIFNPLNPNAYGYDPFYILREDINMRVPNARDIALAIIPLSPNVKDPFWVQAAQNLLTGFILYCSGKNLGFVQTMKYIQSLDTQEFISHIISSTDEDAKLFVSQFAKIDEKVLGGIMTELGNQTMLFATDPLIQRALSTPNYITPADIENGFDIYISIPEERLEQWKSLLNIICTQFLKHCESRKENLELEPILFLLDEFARLGKIEPILNGLATLRSKKITVAIITQSLAQLDMIYGKEQRQVIADNCSYKAILKATDSETQEYLSRLVGTFDRAKKSKNVNYDFFGMASGGGMNTTTEEKRIIKPEEFAYLEQIILLTPKGFMRVNKTPYYKVNFE